MQDNRMNKGFTLLELMVAIFILALMSLLIWQITNNTYRGTDKAAAYDTVYQYGRVSMKRVTDDLSMAFLVGPSIQGKLADGTPALKLNFKGSDEGDKDKVSFATFAGLRLIKNEKKSDEIQVGYFVDDCPDTEERTSCLMRRESGKLGSDEKEGEAFAVAKGVKKFNLEYYDPVKQEWRGDWNTEDPVFQNKLPRAVRVSLVFDDPKREGEEIDFVSAVMLPLSSGPIEF